MINFKKRTFLLFLVIGIFSFANASVFFDSKFGVGLFTSEGEKFGVSTEANFSSQLQIGNNFLIETDFALTINNLFADPFLQNVPSLFSVNKVSTSYNFDNITFPTRVGLFISNQDFIGTDILFQKYFGTKDIDSPFFEQQFGKNPTGILTINGYGVEVGTIFIPKMVNSFYLYVNENYGQNHLNLDTRVSFANEIFLGDFLFGFSFPIDPFHYTLEDGLTLPINRADLHFVSSMLLADNPHVQIFIQLGLTRLQLNPKNGDKKVELKNSHFYFEPRFSFNNIKTSFSFFTISEEASKSSSYAEYPFGGSFYIAGIVNFDNVLTEFGGHISVTSDVLLQQASPNISLIAAPFANFSFNNSEVKVAIPIKPLSKNKNKIFSFTLSYAAHL